MKRLMIVLALAACGSTPAPAPQTPPSGGVVKDTRTPLEKRRDAACEIVGKRVSACAKQDSDTLFAAGKITQKAHDQATEPAVVAKDAEVYSEKCEAKKDYSSRQIRVLEMCPKYETECEPFLACLQNLQPKGN